MKKLLMAIAGTTILALAACGGGGDKGGDTTPEPSKPDTEEQTNNQTETDPKAEDDAVTFDGTYDAAAAEASYKSCAGCHGNNLEGSSAPALTGTGLSPAEILDIIENGRGGMPAGVVKGDDAVNLAAWLADQ